LGHPFRLQDCSILTSRLDYRNGHYSEQVCDTAPLALRHYVVLSPWDHYIYNYSYRCQRPSLAFGIDTKTCFYIRLLAFHHGVALKAILALAATMDHIHQGSQSYAPAKLRHWYGNHLSGHATRTCAVSHRGGAGNELFHIYRHDVVPLYHFNYVAPVLKGSDERFPPSMRCSFVGPLACSSRIYSLKLHAYL
jgi:hypothetical protein